MLTLNVQSDIDLAVRKLNAIGHPRQIPFSVARALTKTAYRARDALRTEIGRVFDRPTPFTVRSVFVQPRVVPKAKLAVRIGIVEDVSGGTPPQKYLAAEITGGPRAATKFEKALRRSGVLKEGWFAVPASGAALDAYGNVARGHYARILADLRVNQYAITATERGRQRKKKRETYFVVFADQNALSGTGRRLPPGIYYRYAHTLRAAFIFVRGAPSYRRRLDVQRVIDSTALRWFGYDMEQALIEAVRTAR